MEGSPSTKDLSYVKLKRPHLIIIIITATTVKIGFWKQIKYTTTLFLYFLAK